MPDEYSLLSRAKALGIQAEVFAYNERTSSLTWERNFNAQSHQESGYGVRVIKDGRMGYSFGNSLTYDLLDLALESSRVVEPDRYNSLPPPRPVQRVGSIYYPEVENSREEIKEAVKSLTDLKGINVISAKGFTTTFRVKVINTEGVDLEEKRSVTGLSVEANWMDESTVSPSIYEYRGYRGLQFDLEGLKSEVVEKVNVTKSRIKNEKKWEEIVLTPKAVEELLYPLLASAFNGENSYRGKSPLKLGASTSETISLADDALLEGGYYSRSFDGEGVPSQRTQLIAQGEVKGFLYNTYWANRAGVQSTASAFRYYTSLPHISPSNLVFSSKVSEDDHDDVVVVDEVQGVHTSNFETGEFSVVASVSWYQRKGEKKGLRELTLSGDLKSLLNGVISMGSRVRSYGPVVCGDLRIKGVSVY